MRTSRILGSDHRPVNYYHCMSRTLAELPYWDEVEKDEMRGLIGKLLAFSGLELVTFCIMGNHIHLVVGVPSERESLEAMSDEALLDRLAGIYSADVVQRVGLELDAHRSAGRQDEALTLRERYLGRMHNLSAFMQELKQRYTCWYNRRHRRRGTIWRERFKSVLVEDSPEALRTMAAYIDLNPVRANLVSDPIDYRWSGYGEAVGARSEVARAGLGALVRGEVGRDEGTRSWAQVQAIYRCWLYDSGREQTDELGRMVKRGMAAERTEAVLAEGGALAFPVLAKLRIRHFTEGVAIGSRAFVEEVFEARRSQFSPKRVDGARKIRNVSWGGLMNLRDLRRQPPL